MCNNQWLNPAATTAQFAGYLFGLLLAGWIADTYGRKFGMLVLTVATVVVATLVAVLPNIWVHIILRAGVGTRVGWCTALFQTCIPSYFAVWWFGTVETIIITLVTIGAHFFSTVVAMLFGGLGLYNLRAWQWWLQALDTSQI